MAKKLLGSGSSGRTQNAKLKGGGTAPGTIDMVNPSASGDPDVVLQRTAHASRGAMLQKENKRSKSTGLKP